MVFSTAALQQTPLQTPLRKNELITFRRNREELTKEIFNLLNSEVFSNRLPADLVVEWSKRLKRTAGHAILDNRGGIRKCRIELAEKVVDSEDKLKSTLLHELCHAAAFLLDGMLKPPHGPAFRKWADRAERVLGIEVNTCHNYEIFTPHKFKCQNEVCGKEYGRHSKKGIDTDT